MNLREDETGPVLFVNMLSFPSVLCFFAANDAQLMLKVIANSRWLLTLVDSSSSVVDSRY